MDERRLVIIKSCSYLRLTDEIRIASDAARETGRQFILAISDRCVLSPALAEFAKRRNVALEDNRMSLYLAIFEGDQEQAGWLLGHYSDFGAFRDKVAEVAEARHYPILMSHSDCDGEWSVSELAALKREVQSIAGIFQQKPPEDPVRAFEHTREYRERATTLYECFHNVDGENLFEALMRLCDEGERRGLPILFQ